MEADAAVKADAADNFLDVGAGFFGQVGNLVDENNSGSQIGVGGVFGQLGRFRFHNHGFAV